MTVYLVGAGPGDPELLTIRAARLLREAEVVLYDRLAGVRGILELVPASATVVPVGKQGGRPSRPQEEINDLLVKFGRRFRTVVRLKGGDPFVFGRGAEEALALSAAGVRVEVVPGVSSATGVPAAAGIPLTHRGTSHAFTVVTGRTAPWASEVDWRSVVGVGGTVVILMGGQALPDLAAQIRAAGLAAETPATVICDGTRPEQFVIRTTLGGLVEVTDLPSSPVVVVGAVAALEVVVPNG